MAKRHWADSTAYVREGGMTPLNSSSVRLMELPPSGKTPRPDYYNIQDGLQEDKLYVMSWKKSPQKPTFAA